MAPEANSCYEDLYPRGLRKFLAIALICSTTLLPAVISWKAGPQSAPQPGPGFMPGMKNTRRSPDDSRLSTRLTVIGLALYYPRWGFKRYALLCGPILGAGSMIVANWYLSGRSSVYRFEIVFASLIGAVPGAALYTLLARRKWRKKHAAESIWIE